MDIIEKIGNYFGIHPLILEDILDTTHRPKIEDLDEYIFIVLKYLYPDAERIDKINAENINIIFGSNFVISFLEGEGDIFNPIIERIKSGKGRIRKRGSDYLAYVLLDIVVDNYFVLLEKIGDRIEEIEELVTIPDIEATQLIHNLKREMSLFRNSAWPLRDVVGTLERGESSLVNETTQLYFKDVYDHTMQVNDTVEIFRDMLTENLDLYLSMISNKVNDVMKVLTIIATIFIPLTFLAGIYGMNFKICQNWNEYGVIQ